MLDSEQRLVSGAGAKPDAGPGWPPGFVELVLGSWFLFIDSLFSVSLTAAHTSVIPFPFLLHVYSIIIVLVLASGPSLGELSVHSSVCGSRVHVALKVSP